MNERVFENIYKEHGKKLFRICLVFTKNEELAAEMVQDIFCSIWERRKTISIQSDWENYLYRAAKFKYYNHFRNVASQKRSLEAYSNTLERSTDNIENKVYFKQLIDKVKILVEDLPPKRKEIYKLSREEGLNSREISKQLQISEKTVKNQLTKALSYLRIKLASYES